MCAGTGTSSPILLLIRSLTMLYHGRCMHSLYEQWNCTSTYTIAANYNGLLEVIVHSYHIHSDMLVTVEHKNLLLL